MSELEGRPEELDRMPDEHRDEAVQAGDGTAASADGEIGGDPAPFAGKLGRVGELRLHWEDTVGDGAERLPFDKLLRGIGSKLVPESVDPDVSLPLGTDAGYRGLSESSELTLGERWPGDTELPVEAERYGGGDLFRYDEPEYYIIEGLDEERFGRGYTRRRYYGTYYPSRRSGGHPWGAYQDRLNDKLLIPGLRINLHGEGDAGEPAPAGELPDADSAGTDLPKLEQPGDAEA